MMIPLLFSLLLLPAVCMSQRMSGPDDNFYLLISMDGFRWDYLDIVNARGKATPNFAALIASGVRAEYMKNAYITVTCPNHWTMATGQHVESHGVVANNYYDPRFNSSFSGLNSLQPHWYNNGTEGSGGEPIWVTYQRASPSDHRSAMVIWPGGNAEVNGIKATYRVPNDNSMPFQERVDHIIQWFTMEEEEAHLGILYFDEPDKTGHQHGPFSVEVEDMILTLDATLRYLIEQLQQYQIFDKTNIILTSDHGMNEVLHVYKLADYIDPDWYTLSGDATPGSLVMPQPGYESEVYAALQKIPNSRVYWKEEIPRHYYYSFNERISPILLMMDLGYMVCCTHHGQNSTVPVGDHGYSNEEPSMHPFFIAHGPEFKSGYTSRPFNNTDIYPLLCHLLGIAPHPNNGSLQNIAHILKENGDEEADGEFWYRWANNNQCRLQVYGLLIILVLCVLLLRPKKTAASTHGRQYHYIETEEDTKPLLNITIEDSTCSDEKRKMIAKA